MGQPLWPQSPVFTTVGIHGGAGRVTELGYLEQIKRKGRSGPPNPDASPWEAPLRIPRRKCTEAVIASGTLVPTLPRRSLSPGLRCLRGVPFHNYRPKGIPRPWEP